MFTKNFLVFALALSGQFAFAAGFEKSIPFGGQAAGVAGIGTPYMQGAQALFYNPAGLVSDKAGQQDVSLNISPTTASYKAPVSSLSSQDTAENKMVFPFGLMYGNTLNEKLGVGAGVYVAGGNMVEYKTQTGFTSKTELQIVEAAIGAGYKVTDDLKLGLDWRVVMVSGNMNSTNAPNNTVEADSTGLKDTRFTGFKLGAQYKLSNMLNLGFTYRSEVNFKAKGKYSQQGLAPMAERDLTLGGTFPAAWTLGLSHQLTDEWKWLGELVYTEYSKVDNLAREINGVSSPVILKWKDQTNVRLAAEYSGMSWPIRFGYIYTSQVTDADHASPTMTPPGAAHGLTLGTGQKFDSFRIDGGFEYTMVSGSMNQDLAGRTGYTAKNELNTYSLHLGGTYTF